jgi:uncharacterized membrane protein YkoI
VKTSILLRKRVLVPAAAAVAALAIGGFGWVAAADDGPDRDEVAGGRHEQLDADDDDRLLSVRERAAAERAAVAAVPGGIVTDAEASDDPGVSYEVELRDPRGIEWEVDLDASFALIAKAQDD